MLENSVLRGIFSLDDNLYIPAFQILGLPGSILVLYSSDKPRTSRPATRVARQTGT